MASNTELCNDLRAHLQSLNDELLQPLVGKTADDIPKTTQAAVETCMEYVGVVSFGNRYLIDDHRCIIDGLKQQKKDCFPAGLIQKKRRMRCETW